MTRTVLVAYALVCLAAGCERHGDAIDLAVTRYESQGGAGGVRFAPIDIFLDAASNEIAAYQVELEVISGTADIVGVEGASLQGFEDAPYYDPAALKGGRIIVAAFSTKSTVPRGAQRVATVHMRERGDALVTYRLTPMVVADARGEPVQARAYVTGRKGEAR
jgi:hypothetical protein